MSGDDFVCLSDDDGLKHIDNLLKSKYTAKDMRTLGFEDSDVKSLLLMNRVFRVGSDQVGQYWDIEPDLRHAPLIISESGCNTKTKTVSTREKFQDKQVLDERRSPILSKENATRYRSACMKLFILGPANERDSRIRLCSIETCSAVSGGETQSSAEISKTETC